MNNSDKLNAISEGIEQIYGMIRQKNIPPTSNDTFTKRRNYFITIGTTSTALVTWFMFEFYLPLFSISFGFFLSFVMMGFVVLFDEYILPGNTLERISRNALASAICILSFALIVIFGAQIGNSLISDPTPDEEHVQPSKSIRYIPDESKEN